MLVIPVKDGENIDRALKRFKRKFLKKAQLIDIAAKMPDSDYKEYIEGLL